MHHRPALFTGQAAIQSAGCSTHQLPALQLGALGSEQESQACRRDDLRCSARLPLSPSRPLRPASGPHLAFRFLTRAHPSLSVPFTRALVYFGRITSRGSFKKFRMDQSKPLFRHLAASLLADVCHSNAKRGGWVVCTSVSFTPSDWVTCTVLSFDWIALLVNHTCNHLTPPLSQQQQQREDSFSLSLLRLLRPV